MAIMLHCGPWAGQQTLFMAFKVRDVGWLMHTRIGALCAVAGPEAASSTACSRWECAA